MFNVCVLRLTSPVPESPVMSKSEALSKPFTYAVVATFAELSEDACVVAVTPSARIEVAVTFPVKSPKTFPVTFPCKSLCTVVGKDKLNPVRFAAVTI